MPASICRRASCRTARSSIESVPAQTVSPAPFHSRSKLAYCLLPKVPGRWNAHNPSTSLIVNQPRRPWTQRAASSAPRAKMLRSRAAWVSVIVSPPPSKPMVCVPGMAPARVEARRSALCSPRRAWSAAAPARCRTARPVRRVMELVRPGAELLACRHQLRRTGDDGGEQADAQREVRRGHDADAARLGLAADGRLVARPSGGADDDVEAARGEQRKIDRDRVAGGEVNRDVRLRPVAAAAGAVAIDPARHDEAVLAAQRLDEPAHAPAPEQQQAAARGGGHRAVPRRLAASNAASCSRDIADATSRSLSTTVTFRRDAACDTIRSGTPSRTESRRMARRGSVAQAVADGAQNRHVALDDDVGELLERGHDLRQLAVVVHRHRHADLGRRHDVDRGAVGLEDLEEAAQEPVRHQHAGGRDLDDRDAALARQRRHAAAAGADAAVMRVPSPSGRRLLRMRTGMSAPPPGGSCSGAGPWRRSRPARRLRRTTAAPRPPDDRRRADPRSACRRRRSRSESRDAPGAGSRRMRPQRRRVVRAAAAERRRRAGAVLPTKPPRTGTRPAARWGTISRSTAARVSSASGRAAVCWSSVTSARLASIQAAGTAASSNAAATMRLLTISPTAATASSERGDDSRRMAMAVSTARRSSISFWMTPQSAAARAAGGRARGQREVPIENPIDAGVDALDAALRVRRQREQLVGGARRRRHDDHRRRVERARVALTIDSRRPMASPSATDVPPNFITTELTVPSCVPMFSRPSRPPASAPRSGSRRPRRRESYCAPSPRASCRGSGRRARVRR